MKRNLSIIAILAVLSFVLCGCPGGGGGGGTQDPVELGFVEWDSEIASTNVIKKVLEDEGYDVNITAVDAGVMWTGVAQGEFDGTVAAWLPQTHQNYLEQVKDDVENLGPNLEGAKIGMVVPDYVEVDSIDELNDYRDRFDGQIVGIEPGSGVVQATEDAIDEYNLDFELNTSSSSGMAASLSRAINNEDWIAVTGWTPHWKWVEFDLKYLEDPENVYGGEEHINTIVRENLESDMPDVYKILDNFNWSPDDMGEVMLDIQEGTDPADAAAKWVNDNQDKVNEWTNI